MYNQKGIVVTNNNKKINSHSFKMKLIKGEMNNICKLIFGENLIALKKLIEDFKMSGNIDLIYIDPPFSTNNEFRISPNRANSISKSNKDNIAYKDNLKGTEYLKFIKERLLLLKDLLSNKGSIYFHIDYKIGHYIKVIMDEIFGISNFRNDISRIKCNPKNFNRRAYGNVKDMILFYSKSDTNIWNNIREPFSQEDILNLFKKIDENGRRYTTIPLHAPGETQDGPTGKKWKGILPPKGRHWRCSPSELDILDKDGLIEWSRNGNPRRIIFADEKNGKKIQDIWEFKDPQYPSYPTEKNIKLLEKIILNSSNEDSIVLDCFCGSGTTIRAAQKLGRKWIGIDNSKEAIRVTLDHLEKIPNTIFNEFNYSYFELQEIIN